MSRAKGQLSKNKIFLLKRLQDMYGDDFHPIMKMAENADKLQKESDNDPSPLNYKAALEGWEKIAQYVEPKLKATEQVTIISGTLGLTDLSEESLDAKLERLANI